MRATVEPGHDEPWPTARTDVVDAHVAFIARDDDLVLTSDAGDLRRLLRARGSAAHVRSC
jgi:uncharacterized protein YaiI (UPF0178 family)